MSPGEQSFVQLEGELCKVRLEVFVRESGEKECTEVDSRKKREHGLRQIGRVVNKMEEGRKEGRKDKVWAKRPRNICQSQERGGREECNINIFDTKLDVHFTRIARSSLFVQFCEPFPKKSPPSPILCRAAAFFIKSAIVAGLICWTCSEGLWGSSTETEELYYRMTSVIFPDRQTSLPRFEEVKYSVFEVYNDMLVKGMDIMVSVPRDVYQRLQEFLFPCSATRKRERRAKRSDEY
ncbi:hypothetical protein ALC62_07911 [Cyphomyrmex costatus]|uniref:MICOS complex subunit MIC13 n=1 Tax=Cyphomyrmex costatus TaxID=456900 RepID=A0A195CLF0_9HYME|nr:hypothetical protein ALC62_07911 [Cyphomyrmex costatus]